MILTIIIGSVLMCSTFIHGLDNPLEVTSPAGSFKGTTLLSLQGHLFSAYLGIPFALPPVGILRFARPQPYPKIDDKQEGDALKKVYFYIHGGGFFMGSSREYLPGDLVALGDVIVVTFNYRLSWLGFLKGNTSELPGNQGMWDQLMALHWVKDNIRSFGGDPDDITIGGNSMGGESVSVLSIIPHAKGLFTKGHIMSGTMFSSPSTPGSSDVLLDLMTDRVGCKLESTDATVKCLRELSADTFVLPLESHLINKFTTIDGNLFPSSIKDLIGDKDYLEKVGFYNRDYIISVTNNEGAVQFYGPFDLGIDPDKMSASFLSQIFHIPVPVCEKILTWYQQPGHFAFKPSHDVIDDYIIGFPVYKFLETTASDNNGTDHAKIGKFYFMYFDYLPSYLPSTIQGMGHGFDLMYLFDMHPDQMLQYYYYLHTNDTFSEVDFQIKNTYIGMLTDLMKSGNPSVTLKEKFSVQWSAFDLKLEDCLIFSLKPSIKPCPLRARWHFWKELFPQYMKDYSNSINKQEL